jgi:hypothetical protein
MTLWLFQSPRRIAATLGITAFATAIVLVGTWLFESEATIKPNVFKEPLQGWLFDSGNGTKITESDCTLFGAWITRHQSNWKRANLDDFKPWKIQVSCDNYDIQISEPEVILDYYKNAKDEVADDDSDIKVRRDITSNERDCLLSAVSRIKALKSN